MLNNNQDILSLLCTCWQICRRSYSHATFYESAKGPCLAKTDVQEAEAKEQVSSVSFEEAVYVM